MPDKSHSERLDALVTGLEDLILEAKDREIEAACDAGVAETRALVEARLAARKPVAVPPIAALRRRRRIAARRAVPADAAGRRRLLGRLVASGAKVPAHIGVRFESREPGDDEIAEMLDELLREGLHPETE